MVSIGQPRLRGGKYPEFLKNHGYCPRWRTCSPGWLESHGGRLKLAEDLINKKQRICSAGRRTFIHRGHRRGRIELTAVQPADMERGRFYRPVKQQVTALLDTDVLAWLKAGRQPYQSRMNAIPRRAMLADREA